MMWIELAILLLMILIGAQMKGIGLGLMGIIGLAIFVFGFGLAPANPPLDVMLIIMAIVTTAAALEASGGLDYLVSVAERIIRKNPSRITLMAPLVTYLLCLFAGTAHILYSLIPIISEVSAKQKIRPERPLSMSVIASHMAITGSPMSAATAAMVVVLAYPGALQDILLISIPACVIGLFFGVASVWRMGKPLEKDPGFIEKMKNPAFKNWIEENASGESREIKKGAKTAVFLFFIAILLIVFFGSFPQFIPNVGADNANFAVKENGALKMGTIIELITLSIAAIILLVTKTKVTTVSKTSLFSAMATAVISVFGVVWMSATFMQNHLPEIKSGLGDLVITYPWAFAIAVFTMGILMFSQAATTKTMMPLGLTLGLSNPTLIAIFPAVSSDFVVPGYPTLLAAISMDKTGTTKIGKWVLNHSFIRPGMIAIWVAIGCGFLLTKFLL